jgi:hypothetical protein
MAVQAPLERSSTLGRPNLYVIDLDHATTDIVSRRLVLRRRRLARRARQAAEAAVWLAGAAALMVVVLGGLAGLR